MNSSSSPGALPPPQVHGTRVPLVLGSQSVLLALALLVYGLRIYSRSRPTPHFMWDDCLITFSMICAVITFGLNCKIISDGYGHHVESIPPTKLVSILKYSFMSGVLLIWGVTFTKVSVACMLLRLQQGKAWTWIMSTAIFILLTITTIFTCFTLTQCNPISSAWNLVLDPNLARNCTDRNKAWAAALSTSVCFTVSDFFFSLLPLTFIFKIQVPLREKLVLCVLMGLGLVASIASVFKAVNSNVVKGSRDGTWDSVPLVVWGFVEEHLAIIAACIPCLKALFEQLLRRAGFTITYKSRDLSVKISTYDHTTRNTTLQDGMDWTAQLEDAAPSSGTWHKMGNDSNLGYDSEGCMELRVYTAKT